MARPVIYLFRILSKQLVSSNRYRVAFINRKSNNTNGTEEDIKFVDLLSVVKAIMRIPYTLSPKEQRRIIRILRAGWPEIFESEKEKEDVLS